MPKFSSSYLFPASLNHTDLLGVFPVQLVTLHPPRTDQEQSQGSFIEGGSHTTSKRLPLDTLSVVLTGEDKPLICHPRKVLPLSYTLSPHNVSPFQKLAIPHSGTASQCNLLQGVPPWGIGAGDGQIEPFPSHPQVINKNWISHRIHLTYYWPFSCSGMTVLPQ